MIAFVGLLAPPAIIVSTYMIELLRARRRERVEKSQSEQAGIQREAKT